MKYDYLVVGAGIAGLTAARILSMSGAKVLLIEKDDELGGACKRFHLGGVPFDTGFHFTGGLAPDRSGLLDQLLEALQLTDSINPIYYGPHSTHRMLLPFADTQIVAPIGAEPLAQMIRKRFPDCAAGIDKYFELFDRVVANTPNLDFRKFDQTPHMLAEDTISLQSVLDQHIPDPLAQLVLGAFCLCYGCKPEEVSFATHVRICFAMHHSMARVIDGGQSFVDAAVGALRQSGVDIQTGVALSACQDMEGRVARRFALSDGSTVEAAHCVLTIHPEQIVGVLPEAVVSKGFRQRVADFEPSIGFFAMFGAVEDCVPDPDGFITTTYPHHDLNQMLTCHTDEPVPGPMLVLRSSEEVGSHTVDAVSVLEVSFPQWTAKWSDSTVGQRPADYYEYKQRRVESMMQRIEPCMPESFDQFQVIDSASMLTFRDYLHNPEGAAYGIRQKLGQFNVVGRLPVTNCYAIGQNALLPGILGAMASSFMVCRSMLGSQRFGQVLA